VKEFFLGGGFGNAYRSYSKAGATSFRRGDFFVGKPVRNCPSGLCRGADDAGIFSLTILPYLCYPLLKSFLFFESKKPVFSQRRKGRKGNL
jgi:hypothetical protein